MMPGRWSGPSPRRSAGMPAPRNRPTTSRLWPSRSTVGSLRGHGEALWKIFLLKPPPLSLIFLSAMATPAQDPVDPFTFLIEEWRPVPGVHGREGSVASLIRNLFLRILRLLAGLAEQVRAGKLPDTAPAPDGGASPRPAGASEQPEMPPEIKQPIAEAPLVNRILRDRGVVPRRRAAPAAPRPNRAEPNCPFRESVAFALAAARPMARKNRIEWSGQSHALIVPV